MKVYLSIGSDLGDRKFNIDRAVALLSERFGTLPSKVSRVVETPAMGFEGPDFLNIAVLFETGPMEAESVLDICQAVEADCGRAPHSPVWGKDGKRVYEARTIDIDILYIDDLVINTVRLTLPHPGIEDRPFVKIPLGDILPQGAALQSVK